MNEINNSQNSVPQDTLKQYLNEGNGGKPYAPRTQKVIEYTLNKFYEHNDGNIEKLNEWLDNHTEKGKKLADRTKSDWGSMIRKFAEFELKVSTVQQITESVQNTTPIKRDMPANTDQWNGALVYRVDPKDYLITKKFDTPYVDFDGVKERLEAHFKTGEPLLIEGETGTGKTQCIMEFAYENQIPMVQLMCSEGTKLNDLKGHPELDGDYTPYVLGALSRAIQIAIKTKKCILYIDEIGLLNPQMQGVLNELLDDRKSVTLERLGVTLVVPTDAKFMIVATTNPSTYGGRNSMNKDLNSRFCTKVLSKATKERYMTIANSSKWNCDDDVKQGIESMIDSLNDLAIGNEVEYLFSPRDLNHIWEQVTSETTDRITIESKPFKLFCEYVIAKYRAESEPSRRAVEKVMLSCCGYE